MPTLVVSVTFLGKQLLNVFQEFTLNWIRHWNWFCWKGICLPTSCHMNVHAICNYLPVMKEKTCLNASYWRYQDYLINTIKTLNEVVDDIQQGNKRKHFNRKVETRRKWKKNFLKWGVKFSMLPLLTVVRMRKGVICFLVRFPVWIKSYSKKRVR